MRPVSQSFLDAITGSHKMVARARVLPASLTFQFGLNPTGVEIPILDGDVKLTATADIKGTLDLTTSGEFWDLLQPYGSEIFVERGIDYGDGTREWVGLGYYQVVDVDQDDAPNGPIRIAGQDRNRQLQQSKTIYPYQFTADRTHEYAFDRFVNGNPDGLGVSTEGYGMFIYTLVPITFDSYDATAFTVPAGTVVEGSHYDFLAKVAADRGCVIRFDAAGELHVTATDVASAVAVYTIEGGRTGTLVKASRSSTRRNIYNLVSAYGSDPAFPTGYGFKYLDSAGSPLRWYGPMGYSVRYFASPLLKDIGAVNTAAVTILARATGLPTNLSLLTVPNPALEPLDVVNVRISNFLLSAGGNLERHVVDEVTVPLTADGGEVRIKTRTLNAVEDDDGS